jgi:hypothetical protein
MFLLFVVGIVVWLVDGAILGDLPLMVANLFTPS